MRPLPDGYTIQRTGAAYELRYKGWHVAYWPGSYSHRGARRHLRRMALDGLMPPTP